MSDEGLPPSPAQNAVALVPVDPEWQPIFHVSNQVVLYNPTSHALSISHSSNFPERPRLPCPYCKQPLPSAFEHASDADEPIETLDSDPAYHSRASDYFQLLAIANETNSRPSTPPPILNSDSGRGTTFPAEAMAEGYFKAFFQEEYKLGMGANGSVFLCQHMLDGNPLGHFAVKKIAVGESHSYLLKILREVRLLERLHHPNIITYHHAWLETCQFSAFGPKVPTLHVLMQWAEGGSLDDFIDVRLGRGTKHIHVDPLEPSFTGGDSPSSPTTPTPSSPVLSRLPFSGASGSDQQSRSARIRAFRAFQRASPEERARMQREMDGAKRTSGQRTTWTAVHLLSADEVKSLFRDVVEGLAFLHNRSILHLDLKPGNVLLTWDEGKLIPRAMLSDFGTSRDMVHTSRARSGNTGTLEYTSPESLPSPHTGLLQQIDSKSDMWSLGMILHKLLFFRLPYRYAAEGDANGEPLSADRESDKMERLEKEVLGYPGFKFTPALATAFEARRLPRAFLILLEGLLNVAPSGRPSCERVSGAIREGRLDPLKPEIGRRPAANSSLVPVSRRRSGDEPASVLIEKPRTDSDDIHESSAKPNDDTHSDPGPREEEIIPTLTEETPLLGLPAPYEDPYLWRRALRGIFVTRIPRKLWARTIKSCILVAKVLSVSSICAGAEPRTVMVIPVLFVAILDTWFDELWTLFLFAAFHICVVKLACLSNHCCT